MLLKWSASPRESPGKRARSSGILSMRGPDESRSNAAEREDTRAGVVRRVPQPEQEEP